MENNELRKLTKEFLHKNNQLLEEELYKFLLYNQYKIAENYNENCHREDIICDLEEKNYNIEKISDELIDEMLWHFEDQLGNYGSECGWRTILDNTIVYFKEELEEYLLEENE